MIKPYLYASIGLAAVAGLVWFVHDQREVGYAKRAAEQEKSDAQFRVRSAQGAVEYDVCDRAGGLYDFRRGSCKLP